MEQLTLIQNIHSFMKLKQHYETVYVKQKLKQL